MMSWWSIDLFSECPPSPLLLLFILFVPFFPPVGVLSGSLRANLLVYQMHALINLMPPSKNLADRDTVSHTHTHARTHARKHTHTLSSSCLHRGWHMLAWWRGLLFLVRKVFQVKFFLFFGQTEEEKGVRGKENDWGKAWERGGLCLSSRRMERWGWFSTWPRLGFTQKPYSRPRFMSFPLIWIPRFSLFGTLSPLKPYFFSPPQREIQRTQKRKMDPSSSRPSFFPPLHPSFTPLFSLSLSLSLGLKGLCFQRKRLHSMGERGRKKKKKKSSSFFVFFFQTAAVSHIASPIHTITPHEPSPCPNPPQNTTLDNPTAHLPPRLSSLHTPPAHPAVWVAGCLE